MKRIFVMGLMVFLAAGAGFGSIMLKVTSFSPANADFKSIYGGGMTYGGELSLALAKGFDVWVGASCLFQKRENELHAGRGRACRSSPSAED